MTFRTSGPRASSFSLSRLVLSVLTAGALALSPSALEAQATAPAVAFGSVNVGASATGTVTFTFSAATTVTSVYVLSQGATNGDFQLNTTAPGTCAATAYSSGNTCTVGVTFTAGAPGTRAGAVTLATGSGPQAGGYAAVYGTGTGAQLALPPGVETAIANATTGADAFEMASDQAGNLYYDDYQAGNLYKDAISGTTATQTTIASGLGNVAGIAVDGAGDVFLAAEGAKVVYEYPYLPATGTYGPATTVRSCAAACWAVAVDPAGSLFVGEGANVYRALAGGSGTFGAFTAVASGFSNIIGLAVTAADTLLIADTGAGKVYVATTSNGTTYVSTLIDSGHSNVNGMGIDAAGDLYASDTTIAGIQKYTPNGSGGYTKSLIGSIGSNGVTVTPGGTVYANNDALQVYVIDQTQVASTTSSSLNYASPPVSTPAFNSGNAALTITTATTPAPFQLASTNACTASATVASATNCSLAYQFLPTSATTPQTGTLTLTTSAGTGTVNLTGNVSGAATKVVFYTAPPATLAAGGNPGTLQAVLEDANSYYVTTPGVSVSLSSNYNTSTSYGSAATAASGGLATFNATTPALTTAGAYTYTAASSGLTGATAGETVTPGPATQLSATPASTSVYVGQADAITVKALDAYGNVATSDTDTVSLAAAPSTATLPPNFALASGSGSGNVTFTAAGTYTVTAQDVTNSGIASGATATITVQPLPVFTVTTLSDDATATAANCTNQAANGATPDAACSLRDAVAAANGIGFTGNTGLQTTISFAPALYTNYTGPSTCTVSSITPAGSSTAVTTTAPCIVLSASTASMAMSANVNIAGPGPAALAVSGNSAHTILNTGVGSLKLTISGLTLTLGTSTSGGGALANTYGNSAIALQNDVFYKNVAAFEGGAVFDFTSGNTLTIGNSSFDANTVSSTNTVEGGALFLSTVAYTISGSSFTNNTASALSSSTYAIGGAIYATASPASTVRNSSFAGNTASTVAYTAYGGAIYSTGGSGNDTFTGTVFLGNTAKTSAINDSVYGGALYYVTKSLTLVDSLMQGNVATSGGSNIANGGAIYGTGLKYLYNTTITGNYAKGTGGGTYGVLYAFNSIVYGNGALSSADSSAVNQSVGSLTSANSPALLNPLLSTPSNAGSFAGPMAGAGAYAAALMTVVPLPGSPALRIGSTSTSGCSGSVNNVAQTSCLAGQTTDARGYARTQTVGGATYVDAGPTEASYTAAFVFQPANALAGQTIAGQTSLGATSPYPSVQLYEQGVPFAFSYFVDPTAGGVSETTITTPLPLTVSATAGTLSGTATPAPAAAAVASTTAYDFGTAQTATGYSGLFNLGGLSISPAEANDTLLSTFCVGACAGTKQTLVVASNPFNVVVPIAFSMAPPADLAIDTSPGTIVVNEYNAGHTAYVSGDTVTLTVTGTSATNYTATYTATGSNGAFTFTPAALAAADTYTYTATDTAYTTQTAVATETVANQLLGSLVVSGFPSPDHNGAASNITVTAYDTTGALFTSFTGTVTLTSSDPLATLPAPYTFTGADAGAHTFSVTLNTGGAQTITATSAPISGSQTGIVVDDFVWLLNSTGATLKLDETGAEKSITSTASSAGTFGGIAFDSSGNAWSVTSGANALVMTTKADAAPTTYSGTGGLSTPVSVAVDGAGMIWVANSGNNSVSEFSGAGAAQSGTSGYGSSTLSGPSQVNIDNTGGVWVSNKSGSSLTHIFGAATPVISPTATAVTNGTTGQKP